MRKILLIFGVILIQGKGENLARMGEEFMKLRNWPVALNYFEEALKENPSLGKAWFGKGLCLCELKKFEEGISALSRATELEPRNPDYLYVMGVCYEWRGREYWEDAELYYKKALEVSPGEAQLYHKLATLYQRQQRYEDAIKWFKKALELDPNYYISYNNLGSCYLALHKPAEAIRLYQEAIRRTDDPGQYHFYFHLGIAFLADNRIKEAKSAFLLESALNPDFADPHLNLGNIYLLEQNLARGIEEYRQVLKIDPDHPEAHYNLGQLYLSLNQNQLAFKHFKRYVELKPENGAGHFHLGICYARLGEKEKAWEEYSRSLELGYQPEILRRKMKK